MLPLWRRVTKPTDFIGRALAICNRRCKKLGHFEQELSWYQCTVYCHHLCKLHVSSRVDDDNSGFYL